MPTNLSPPPLDTPIVDKLRLLTKTWNAYYLDRDQRIQAGSQLLQTVTLTGQSGAIGTTPFALGTVAAGLYRVSYHAKVTTAASTSSSLIVSVTYTRGGFTCVQAGAALIGNTTTTVDSASFLLRADAATAISYSTTYLSVGGTALTYEVDLIVQSVDS